SSRRRHTRWPRDWSSDVCSSDLGWEVPQVGKYMDDLYICQPAGLPNRLYRNHGDGTFDDVTEKAGVGVLDSTACALFADFENKEIGRASCRERVEVREGEGSERK